MLEYRTRRCFVQTGAAVGPGLGALVYAGLYAVLPEAIAWRALFAAPTSLPRDPRRTTRCRVRGLRLRTLLFGQAIARFGIAVAVWLNAGLLAAAALAEQPIGCALLCTKSLRQRLAAPLLVALGLGDRTR